MSAIITKQLIKRCSAVLSILLFWMSGVASLSHSDADDDSFFVGAVHYHLTRSEAPASPDMCAACAWNSASNVSMPTAVEAPAEAPYLFESPLVAVVRLGNKTVQPTAPRGPPTYI